MKKKKMRLFFRLLPSLLTSITLSVLLTGMVSAQSISPHSPAATTHGCPSGAVCIYPENAGWNGDHPTHKYYSYGAHNLRNMFGVHRIYNNQTGGATMRTCTGYNGTGCEGYLHPGTYIDKDMTPINSIVLVRP